MTKYILELELHCNPPCGLNSTARNIGRNSAFDVCSTE